MAFRPLRLTDEAAAEAGVLPPRLADEADAGVAIDFLFLLAGVFDSSSAAAMDGRPRFLLAGVAVVASGAAERPRFFGVFTSSTVWTLAGRPRFLAGAVASFALAGAFLVVGAAFSALAAFLAAVALVFGLVSAAPSTFAGRPLFFSALGSEREAGHRCLAADLAS